MKTQLIVHAVRAWSSNSNDEAPLCGLDKNAPEVWNNRTIYHAWVTCENCLQKIKEVTHNCPVCDGPEYDHKWNCTLMRR
jgi:hypothetical protein